MIGPGLIIECDNHVFNHIGKTMFETRNQREIGFVNIENDVWIGANVLILPNVNIGEGSVVGAGSVITKSLPPYSICVGIPCKPIKTRFSKDHLSEHLKLINSQKTIDSVLHEWDINKLKLQ
jgi:acetyltransferase-like isoleucine patch superfamily enzyme